MRLITKAVQNQISLCKSIFDTFGLTLGLHYDYIMIELVFIFTRPLPEFLAQKDWEWETQDNVSKYLGVFTGNQVEIAETKEFLLQKLEKRLEKVMCNTTSLTT